MVYEFHQDDPRKCTSAKLRRFQLVQQIHTVSKIPSSAIVLNPTSQRTLTHEDRSIIQTHGLVGLDCSWNSSEEIFQMTLKGQSRRLPTLLAGNPTNYSIKGRLSTAEALAAALIISGFSLEARRILSIFKWGETFLTLNKEPLTAYQDSNAGEITKIEREYFDTAPSQ